MSLLDGKKALVAGVANKKSIAWGIAQALYAYGAQLAFICHETNVRRVTKLAPHVNSETIIPCDVRKDEDIIQAFDQAGAAFDTKLDILVHSIAYASIDDLEGEFVKTSRSGWHRPWISVSIRW
jgi:enoyl-[acyl-carrier protein] reductase I